MLELTHHERSRIFNLGYYTWVEQQGVPLAAFERRRSQEFWAGLRRSVPAWDRADRRVQCRRRIWRPLLTIAYSELLGRTRERDRSLREKVTSLEAAAALVPDGASVGIGGSTLSRTPLAMIWALIRAGRRDLHCVRSISRARGNCCSPPERAGTS